jgi:Na+/phosphate symporter
MFIAIWPAVIMLVGLLMFMLIKNSDWRRIGEIMFFVGLFWMTYAILGHTLHIG